MMKLLVFAHTPPPHHGQSYMVKLMLDGFGGDRRGKKTAAPNAFGIECYHVNARFSKTLGDIGEFRGGKLFLILWACLQAIGCRFRHGVTTLYYVPAPGKTIAVYRDWLVMLICRPFFKKIILHWHAAGLGPWLETAAQIRERAITYRVFKPVDLSIVLSDYNRADAAKLLSRRIQIVHNGIPDPCPDFTTALLPRRRARFAVYKKLLAGEQPGASQVEAAGADPNIVRVLFLAHCTREKGLFATMEGVAAANRRLAERHSPLRLRLAAAGSFVTAAENKEFNSLRVLPEFAGVVEPLGFVAGAAKIQALREADVFCFPTRYLGENQPVNLIEAMAFGLPILTTRWRSLPEMLPPGYPGLVPNSSPDEIAAGLLRVLSEEISETLRDHFVTGFSLQSHLSKLAAAIRSVEAG